MAINYKDVIHPEDESALRQFENTAGVKMLVEKFMSVGLERYLHNLCMSNCLKIGPHQMPEIYERLLSIVQKFDIPEPELFLSMTPELDVCTLGDQKPFIVITKNMLSTLPEEFDFFLARECGHILCRHNLYLTVLSVLARLMDGTAELISALPGMNVVKATILPSAYYAANYWQIRSQYSADRIGAIYIEDENLVQKALLHHYLGAWGDNVNLEACIDQKKQIEEEHSNNSWDKILNRILVSEQSFPFATYRLEEIRKWVRSAQYRAVLDNLDKPACISPTCPNCKSDIDETWKFCRNCGTKL